jgi:diguanylate cyclase (GGDEF)-like protein
MQPFLKKADTLLSKMPGYWVLGSALFIVALLGWLDYVTGFELSFSFFYLLPIAFCAWYGRRSDALIIATGSTLVWAVSNRLAGEVYTNEFIRVFNSGVRLVVFMLFAWLIRELKRVNLHEASLARTDPLTGIYNRREFYARVGIEIDHVARFGEVFSIAYIDLDNFKQVNDTQGHSAGDDLLKEITQAISGTIRHSDVFARLGGDEFALLFPRIDQEGVRVVMGKVERTINEELNSLHSPVTFSAGVVTYHVPPANVNEIIAASDSLMYQAKALGKNQTCYQTIRAISDRYA